ncbi:MAG: fimbria/pilus periplasmic chaperone [Nostoc sp.]|uniref:fimbrial biogenesis chaperone n=1 Tax=Nostoc sp. TaxID=1180 RepID=UPI002FFBDEBC
MKNTIPTLQKFSKIALSLLGAFALGVPSASAINIGVSPPRLEVKINSNKTRTETIRVLNLASEPVTLKATVKSWVMNEDNKPQDIASNEQSLDQWIVFTPSQFTIPAGGAQTIRFAIRPKVQPQPGEHRAVLYLQEVSPVSPIKSSQGVRVNARLGVVIYGYVGEIKKIGILNSITVDTKPNALKAVFDITNKGNAYIRLSGQYAIWPAAQYPGAEATKPIANTGKTDAKLPDSVLDVGSLPSSPVLPDSTRQIKLPITKTLPPGNYVLDVNGELSGVPIDKGIPFTVPAANNNQSENKPSARNLNNSLRRR